MAKKPAKIFKPVPGVYPPAVPGERVQIYRDSTDKDRLSITQQVVEGAGSHVTRSRSGGNAAYEDLLHCLYDGVLITDLDGNIKEVNDRAEHHFLWTKDELCEGNIIPLISGADERLLTVIRANIDRRKYSVLEAICVCADDSRFNAEIVVNRLGDQKIAFFVRDITQRKKVEEELKQANDKLIEAKKIQARIDLRGNACNPADLTDARFLDQGL